MKKWMTVSSLRAGLIFLLMLSLVVAGEIPMATAGEPLTVEGVWVVMSVSPLNDVNQKDLGERISIVNGNDYEVKWLGGSRMDENSYIYKGSPWQIATVTDKPIYVPSGFAEVEGAPAPASLAQECAGITFPCTVSYTLSGNDTILERSQDTVTVYWKNGHYTHYKREPGYYKTTFKRISGPVNKKTPSLAQVESRGEFYFLTKDGRKVSGEEAGNIPLEQGTKVVTGKDGHIKMTLPDNTKFTVGPNSDIVIDEFVYDPDNSPKKVIASMSKGVFRWVTGKVKPLKDPAEMKIKLPGLIGGFRGTDVEATVNPDGSGFLILHSGQLEITENKTGFTFILDAGHKVTFSADGSVSRPIKGD